MNTFTVKNPSLYQEIYSVQEETNIENIFKIAKEKSSQIEKISIDERLNYLDKIQKYILENREYIIDKIISETGKARFDALTSEIFGVLDLIEYLKKESKKLLSDKVINTPTVLMGKKSKIFYEPLGTVLVIAPWNYPFYLTLVPALTAFTAGNSVIIKPSEVTPLKGLLEEIFHKTSMNDFIQVVYGGKDTGEKLIEQRPDKIFFTGSVKTGKKIMEKASQYLIPVELELGGKDAMIVFDDVNMDRTVNGALWGALTNAGQSCTSVERLYVQEEIYSRFINKLEEKIKKLHLPKNNQDKFNNFDMGYMTAEFQIKIVEDHIKDSIEKGAKIVTGGKREENSMFFPPTIITNIDKSMKIINEETFGPVIPIIKFSTEEEVINMANDSEYGLSASVWTKDIQKAERIARKLKVANVSINNVMLTEANPYLPFGGYKYSGFGKTKGTEGLHAFCNIKSVMTDPQSGKVEANWYPYTSSKYKYFSELTKSVFSGGITLLKIAIPGLKLESTSNKEKL